MLAVEIRVQILNFKDRAKLIPIGKKDLFTRRYCFEK